MKYACFGTQKCVLGGSEGSKHQKNAFFLHFWSPKDPLFWLIFFFSLCEKIPKNHGYKNAKEKSIFIFLGREVRFRRPQMVKTSKILCFWHLDTQGPTIRGEFFLPEICLCQNRKKKIMKEIAKKKSKLWAPVVHMAVPQIVKTPDSCVFLHFLVHKNPTQGSKFSRKKKIFFLRFFKNRLVFGKNHEISGSQNHVLDPHRCSKVPNFALNGLKSSKLALFWGEKKNSRVPFPGRQ